ncbi:hypothetical protein [Streptomyces sp. NPDC051677]|uniref:hypothetical protein n=1 Tax=Streptomyces sp. NPDC051677 TaxID=3365669 RepID=UPI0037D11309
MPDDGDVKHSPYDQWQQDPGPAEPGGDPDRGKEYGYLVPNVAVGWGSLPTFNNPPPDTGQGGDAEARSDVPATPPIRVDLSGLRATENTLLSAVRTAVDAYQGLRQHVLSTEDDVFGQNEMDWYKDPTYYGSIPSEVPSKIQPIAREFAASMNPAMEKALYFMGTTLELVGEYIALVNRTGQTYSEVDRKSRFPTEGTSKDVVT